MCGPWDVPNACHGPGAGLRGGRPCRVAEGLARRLRCVQGMTRIPGFFVAVAWLALTSAAARAQPFVTADPPTVGVSYNPANPGVVTIGATEYAISHTMEPDGQSAVEYRLDPSGTVLYARKFATGAGLPVCNPTSGTGNRVVFYRIVDVPAPRLDEIVEECVAGPFSRVGFVGSPTQTPYVAFMAQAAFNGVTRVAWFNLLSAQERTWTDYRSALGDMRFAVDGTVALVQHDTTASAIGVDYQLVDLCPGRMGNPLGPMPGFLDHANTDPYNVRSYEDGGTHWVELTFGNNPPANVQVPVCHAAGSTMNGNRLAVEAQAIPVSPSASLVDFVFSYQVGSAYTNAAISGRLPGNVLVVDDPAGVVDSNGAFSLSNVSGAGAFTVRVDGSNRYGYLCAGTLVQPDPTPYAITATWQYVDSQGQNATQNAVQPGPMACAQGPRLQVRRAAPTQTYEGADMPVTLYFENTGDLVSRNVIIEDLVSLSPTGYTLVPNPDPRFSVQSGRVVFTLGDLDAGQSGTVGYTLRATCGTVGIVDRYYGINGVPTRTVQIYNGFPENQTTVLPVSTEPMTVVFAPSVNLPDVPVGGASDLTVQFTNPASMPRGARFGITAFPCWTWSNASGDGTFGLVDQWNLQWSGEVPPAGTVQTHVTMTRISCAEPLPVFNNASPMNFNYGCGGMVTLNPEDYYGAAGASGSSGATSSAGSTSVASSTTSTSTSAASSTGGVGPSSSSGSSGGSSAGASSSGSSGGGPCMCAGTPRSGGTMVWLAAAVLAVRQRFRTTPRSRRHGSAPRGARR